MVTITRIGLNKCEFFSETPKELKFLQNLLKIYVDGAFYSELYKKGKWDGYHKFFNKDNEFDFGLADEVIYGLEMNNIKWNYVDEYRNERHKIIPRNMDRQRPYQKAAIKEFFKTNIGIIIVPTRGGKTFIASETIKQTIEFDESWNCLFIVDTMDLFKQAVKDISSYIGIKPDEIGYINDKGFEPKQITVAMVQTLVSRLYFQIRTAKTVDKKKVNLSKEEIRLKKREKNREKRKIEKYMKEVSYLIVDEIHEQSSTKRMNVFKKCKNKKQILGLSATPFKQIGGTIQNLTVKGFFGGVCYTIPKSELQEKGYLAMDKVFLFSYDHTSYARRNRIYNLENYREFLTNAIHHNDERNDLLKQIILVCKKFRWKTLVVFNSVEHGKVVSKLTNTRFISGETKGNERDLVKNEFLKGRGKVLLASNIYKKGITLPEAQILVLADGGLEGTNIEQKQGRVLGAVEGKTTAALIDIMDVGMKYFSEHSDNRLETYSNNVTKDRLEVYEPTDIDLLTESLKEWLDE